MFTRTLRYGKGYTGKMSIKCWIATITGSDNTYALARSFLEPAKVEREHFNRARTMIDFSYTLDVGLYEQSEGGEREFFAVWLRASDSKYCWTRIDDARLKAMIALMDGGMSADDARRATKAPQPNEQPKGE